MIKPKTFDQYLHQVDPLNLLKSDSVQLMRAAYDAAITNTQGFLKEPDKKSWSGLARDIMMWLDAYDGPNKTPRNLFKHLEMIGTPIPQWLRDDPEMQNLDHVPSKGTRVVMIYRAMLFAEAVN